MTEDEMFDYLSKEPGPYAIFPNPMRTDGVFVSQDRPKQPYKGVTDIYGNPIYPATPNGHGLPFQVPHAVAERLIARLNAARDKEAKPS